MVKKYQQGGQLSDTQQQGLQYLAQMYAQQTGKDPQQDQEGFMQFVQQLAQQAGVQDIGQLLDMIYQQAQGQAQAAKHGAKLNYLRKLTDKCPEGTELMYFKAGGRVCSQCKEKIDKEACGKKIKKNCGGKKMFQKGEKIVKDQEPAEPLTSKNNNPTFMSKVVGIASHVNPYAAIILADKINKQLGDNYRKLSHDQQRNKFIQDYNKYGKDGVIPYLSHNTEHGLDWDGSVNINGKNIPVKKSVSLEHKIDWLPNAEEYTSYYIPSQDKYIGQEEKDFDLYNKSFIPINKNNPKYTIENYR